MSKSTVDEWLRRGYARTVEFIEDAEGGYWRAYVPQFGVRGLSGTGDTFGDALASLEEVMRLGFKMMAADGEEPPAPVTASGHGGPQASGRLTLRLPPQLHAELQVEAKAAGLSLNQHLVALLAQRHGEERVRRIIQEELHSTLAR